MKNTILISAFPGTGKTYFYNNTELDVLDSDSSTFDKENFPENYINHIKENIGKVDIILISSHEELRYGLEKEKIGYNLVYPDKELKDEYIQRYKERYDGDAFIKLLETNWNEWQQYMEWETGCRHIVLQSGEYLSDRIDDCKTYNPKRWTILGKEQNGNSLKTVIVAETKEDATKLFLEKNAEYKDIIYVRPSGRYSYLVTEEGIMNPKLVDKFYGGRVEVFDCESPDGYAVYEWRFLMPQQAFSGFSDWIEDIETDYPIMIQANFNMDTLEYEF